MFRTVAAYLHEERVCIL